MPAPHTTARTSTRAARAIPLPVGTLPIGNPVALPPGTLPTGNPIPLIDPTPPEAPGDEPVVIEDLGQADLGGRPSAAELVAQPPVRVEPIEIPQPPKIGLRNPPCCGKAMAPRNLKKISTNRYRCTCSACGKRLVVVYDPSGYPAMARVL